MQFHPAQVQEPSGGSYTLYGAQSGGKDIAKARKRMGAVVEKPSIYLNMTARENIEAQYRILGMPSFSGAEELLKLVGLEGTGKKKAKNFSLGMQQRLGIAVALAGSPDFLVLDEPANGLDPQGIIEMRELIVKLNRELEESIAAYYGVLKASGIEPEIHMPDKQVIRILDRTALSRVFANILSNAVKYSTGDLAIVLDESGKITFSNAAPNLHETQVGRLFDRFYTVESAEQSTGLGLAIARSLTERMGGEITAEYRCGRLEISLSFPAR